MDTFTVRDLREKTGDLIRDAEEGKLSIITKHGHPVFLAVPFREELVRWGLHVVLAMNLYSEGALSLSKAAKLAGEDLETFIEKLTSSSIPVVHYSSQELEDEVKPFLMGIPTKTKNGK